MSKKLKAKKYKLVIFNSDSVSFQDITSLFKVFGLTALQSEQCALIIHNVGKYAAFEGGYDELKSIQLGLQDNNIQSEIISDESKTKTKKIKT
jgi:hypothetical protein